MNRLIAYFFILAGLAFLGDAAYDEHRGIAKAASPHTSGSMSFQTNIARRDENPELFRGLMTYQWVRAPFFLLAGYILLGICQRADRTDPFSPDFAGKRALDDLNHILTEEQKKRSRPLD